MIETIHKQAPRYTVMQILSSLLSAAVLLIAFDIWINDFIAMPLRVISTSISEIVVAAFGYDVIREGTSLVVGTFRFNVDTACSGSQTMQQMLATALVLVGIWGGMSLGQKFAAVLLALPIAVAVNGLRVSALMLASLRAGYGLTEETFAHQFIGIAAFATALLIFWHVCKKIAKSTIFNHGELPLRFVITMLLLSIIFFPFFYESVSGWIGSAWNPYNKYAWIFPLVSIILFACTSYNDIRLAARTGGIKGAQTALGLFVFGFGLLWAVVVTKLGFVSIQGLGFISVLAGSLILISGMKKLLLEIPVLLLMILGFPRAPLLIAELSGRQGEYDWSVLFIMRVLAGSVLGVLYVFLKHYAHKKADTQSRQNEELCAQKYKLQVLNVLLLIMAGGGLLWQGKLAENAEQSAGQEKKYLFSDIPLQVGSWQGKAHLLPEEARTLLGGTDAEIRVYTSDYALPIEFFYNFSGGDRHNLHPPEYCLTGAGWKIISKKSVNLVGQNIGKFPITVMELQNCEETRWFAFWFYDGKSIEANYLHMLGEDLVTRLGGIKREWSIYRVIAYREVDLMLFINEISQSIRE